MPIELKICGINSENIIQTIIKSGADKIIMGRSLLKGNIEENIDKVSNSIKV